MPADDAGLYFALHLLRALAPGLPLACLVSSLVGKAFDRFFKRLQQTAYRSVSEGPLTPTTAAAGERDALVDEHGITPVRVAVRRRRDGLLVILLAAVAATYLADGAVLVARALLSATPEWESRRPLWSLMEVYVLLGFVAYSAQALALAHDRARGRAGMRWTPVLFVGLGLCGEVSLLGVLAKLFVERFRGPVPVYPALHISALAARVAVVLLTALVLTPLLYRRDYEPAANGVGAGYGTFAAAGKPQAADGNGTAEPGAPAAPPAAAPPSASFAEFVRRVRVLSPYLWPRKSFVLKCVALVCFAILMIGRVINLLVPIALGRVIRDLRLGSPPWVSLGGYVALRFMQGSGGVLQVLRSNLWIPVSQYSDREMTMMSFNHLLGLSLAYHTRRKTGEVLRVLDRGAAINNFFNMLLFQIAPIGLDIGVAIVFFAVHFSGLLAVTTFIVMVAYVVASVVLTQYRVKLRRAMNDKDKFARTIHTDVLLNWETVKYFTAESYEATRYRRSMLDYQSSEFQVLASLNLLNLVQNFIISLGLLVGSLIVAYGVASGAKPPESFVEWTAYLAQLYGPLNSLGTLYRTIQSNLVDTDNLMRLLAEEKEVVDKPDAVELLKADGEIVFDDVCFSYDGKVDALKNVSFRIPAGASAAFVGESGSGKSTILRLLYRFYDIQSGAIRVDGHDVRDLTQLSLRRQIGVVPQDAVLFNESIFYNIAYGDVDAPRERVLDAARAAQIYDRVQTFPDQWETKVGERGVRLSGGEKQRVSIARTMLKNPPILLLDEATSALDTSTEREIQHALRGLAKGRTSLSIAHRLSTIINSDIIFVVSNGRIVESGSHAELVAKDGVFADLWAKQIRAEVEGMPAPSDGKALAPAAKATDDASGSTTPAHPHH